MATNFFSNRNNQDPKSELFAKILLLANRDLFYTTLYSAIINHPSYVILSDIPGDRKVEILNEMIEYYESREDYEKCAHLVKVKKQVYVC